jgi:Peptidase A4 family
MKIFTARPVALAAGLAALVAALLTGPVAFAAPGPVTAGIIGNQTVPNWAGYYAQNPLVDSVSATFTVPKVNCADSSGTAPYEAALWAGRGGQDIIDGPHVALEQDGLLIGCVTKTSRPLYEPFWEIAPDLGVQVWHSHGSVVTVQPGDVMRVGVYAPDRSQEKGKWQFGIWVTHAGKTAFYTAFRALNKGEIPGTTAEVITERPEFRGHLSGLVNMGTVHYTDAEWVPPYPTPSIQPVTRHTITLVAGKAVLVYPGRPIIPSGDSQALDFNTYRTKAPV